MLTKDQIYRRSKMKGTTPRDRLCLGCNETYAPQGIGPHQKATGHEGIEQVEPQPAITKEMVIADSPYGTVNGHKRGRKVGSKNKPVLRQAEEFMVLTDADGGIWLAERIK